MISHKWFENRCACGCERQGSGQTQVMIKDGIKAPYIECTRKIPDSWYHRKKNDYKLIQIRNGNY